MAHEVDDIFNESESSSSDNEEEIQKEKERAARRRSSRSLSGQEKEEKLEDPSTSELTKGSSSSSVSCKYWLEAKIFVLFVYILFIYAEQWNDILLILFLADDDDGDDQFGCSREFSRKRKRDIRTETETEDEPLSVKFRRGEPLPSDIDSLNLMNPSSEEDEEVDEEDEWMAQQLEREFLDENSQSQDSFGMRWWLSSTYMHFL